MEVACIPLAQTRQPDPLISDYLAHKPTLEKFISGFPTLENFRKILDQKKFSQSSRQLLASSIQKQYKGLEIGSSVADNIQSLTNDHTFTITTGHQLNLFTGPMYFVFKILSTIRLAKDLQATNPGYHFVPVYWMASEDHDFAEINHAWVHGQKLEWSTDQSGAVGTFETTAFSDLIKHFADLLGTGAAADGINRLIASAYSLPTLADATRAIVHELFGKYGLVVLDGNDAALKKSIIPTMESELLNQGSIKYITRTSDELRALGYKTQVNPREINLFYLEPGQRRRIEAQGDTWSVIGSDKQWNREALLSELHENPERFSPNVVLRPLYQERVLPNLAYVGGPGELAYWLQLKSNFENHQTDFPLLVLRDSALILSPKMQARMAKAGLTIGNLFEDKNELIKRLVNAAGLNLDAEKAQLEQLFASVSIKAKSADPTLEAAASAELQKQRASLENFEKRIHKALKTREEVKLQQLDKVLAELLPDGKLNERRDNFFPILAENGSHILDDLLTHFNPLKGELKVVSL